MEKYNFSLNNFLLLTKGWYQNSDNRDKLTLYKRVLKLDGHSYITNMEDVLTVIMAEFENWNEWKRKNNLSYVSLFSFYLQIRDYHFYRKDTPLDELLIDFIKSQFAMINCMYVNITPPIFNRKLYKQGLMFGNKKGQTYKEQNKIVSNFFNKK